jgi:hypothetical protein
MLLNINIVKEAAKRLLLSALMDELEDRDTKASLPDEYRYKDGTKGIVYNNMNTFVGYLMQDEAELIMFVMGKYIGAIGAAWHNDVGLVFSHAGWLEDEEDAGLVLYRLIMSCWGHGVGIGDDHSEGFAKAKGVLDKYHPDDPMEEAPTHFDEHESFLEPIISCHLDYAEEAATE